MMIKKLNYLWVVMLLTFSASAQRNNYNYNYNNDLNTDAKTSRVKYSILAINYEQAKQSLEKFIIAKGYELVKKHDNDNGLDLEFIVSEDKLKQMDSLAAKLGYLKDKDNYTQNKAATLDQLLLDIEYLNQKRNAYKQMLQKMDSVKSDKYYQHWEKIQDIDAEINNLKKKLKDLEANSKSYTVVFHIYDEKTTPTSSDIDFVNMPGGEFSYLFIEAPKPNLSSKTYQGATLKYLFTRGKTFVGVGAFKSEDAISATDTLTFKELFLFSFGQDFYSRHLGRGANKFFNLYTGYALGMSFATNAIDTKTIFFVNPSVGVELFKTKYILLDTRASYFLPFTYNPNLRGIMASASLNFVF